MGALVQGVGQSFDISAASTLAFAVDRTTGGASRRDARSVFLEDSGISWDDGRSHDIDLAAG